MIAVNNLTKRYGDRLVLRGVSFRIAAGEGVGVQGPNGAGKSTLLRLLSKRMQPTSGSIDWVESPETTSWVGHDPGLYMDFSAAENLHFFGQLAGLAGPMRAKRVEQALTTVGLAGAGDRKAREFSRGMKQRLALARLEVEGRKLWLMDEPETGLDRESLSILEGLIHSHRDKGGVAVVVSHHADFLERVSSRLLVLERGRLRDRVSEGEGVAEP